MLSWLHPQFTMEWTHIGTWHDRVL